jgi:hypothetical protein
MGEEMSKELRIRVYEEATTRARRALERHLRAEPLPTPICACGRDASYIEASLSYGTGGIAGGIEITHLTWICSLCSIGGGTLDEG